MAFFGAFVRGTGGAKIGPCLRFGGRTPQIEISNN
jgi:hypothetical protein